MSKFLWRGEGGGTKSDWDDGRNWVDDTGTPYIQANYPGSTAARYDEVVFDAELDSTVSALSPTAYDAIALADEELQSFRVGADYNGTIAAAGWLKIKVDLGTPASEMIIEGLSAGNINIEAATVGTIRILGSTNTTTLKGTFGTAVLLKGTVVVDAATTFSTSLTLGFLSAETDLNLTIPTGVTIPATINSFGGTVNNSVAVTTLNLYGGTWTQSTGDLTAVTINDGSLLWSSGNIDTATIYKGEIDGSSSPIARSIFEATMYDGAGLNLNNGLHNIQITNFVLIQSGGAIISFSPGDEITNRATGGDLDVYNAIMEVGAPNAGGKFDNLADAGTYLTSLGAAEAKTLLIKGETFSDATNGSFPADTQIDVQLGATGITGTITVAGDCQIRGDATRNTGSAYTTTAGGNLTLLNCKNILGNIVAAGDLHMEGCVQTSAKTLIPVGRSTISNSDIGKLQMTSNTRLTNCYRIASLDFQAGSADEVYVSNCEIDNFSIAAAGSLTDCRFSNNVFFSNVDFSGTSGLVSTAFTGNLVIGSFTFDSNVDTGIFIGNEIIGALTFNGAEADSANSGPVDGVVCGHNSDIYTNLTEGVSGKNRVTGAIT